jgi:hypothetical protein
MAFVCFSPDGQRLASMSVDPRRTVVIWDGRPFGPAAQLEREARGVVRALFEKPLLQAEVLAALRADQTLGESVRKEALAMAQRLRGDPERLNDASWAIVSRSGADPGQYRRALRWAETACRLQAEDGESLTTLGIAQYRADQFAVALQTLLHADELNRAWFKRPLPAGLAFLAMTCHRLGTKDQARRYLDQLRKVMAERRWRNYEAGERFLGEAEALLREPEQEKL